MAKELPRLPRLRVTFSFERRGRDTVDKPVCEMVLLDERRELVHRETFECAQGSPLSNIQAVLLALIGNAAVRAGSALPLSASPPAETSAPVPAAATAVQMAPAEPETEPHGPKVSGSGGNAEPPAPAAPAPAAPAPTETAETEPHGPKVAAAAGNPAAAES
jgi:hypothetical protein